MFAKMSKNINKVLSILLVAAMMLTLNLTSMAVDAAAAKPIKETAVSEPSGVTAVTFNGNNGTFYQDDNGAQVYLRYLFPNDTPLSTLGNVTVLITSTNQVTSTDVTVKRSRNVYSFTTDLLNKAPKITISGVDYIVAAGIAGGTRNLVTAPLTGYITAASLNGTNASLSRDITAGICPGNIYYTEQNIGWTTENCYIKATGVTATDIENIPLVYTLDGVKKNGSVNMKTGTDSVKLGNYTYLVNASIEGAFTATPENFRIDFQELRNSTDPQPSQEALNQAKEIEAAVAAYYADADTQKVFAQGTTNMDVLQTILQWCQDNGKFTLGDTTLGSGVTYVAEINGLGEFSVGAMSGWMYTNDPNPVIAPENWYTAPIGAADYEMSPDSNIAWFYTVDYGTHPW